LFARPWIRVFEGEETLAGGNGNETPVGGAGNDTLAGGADDEKPKFSQKQLNKILADDRRKHEEKVKDAVTQLEQLKKAKGLSEKERVELQAKIEDLNNSLLTKEEQAKKEIEKRDKQYKQQLESESQEKTYWQSQYTQETTQNQIMAAAIENEAVKASQILDLLTPKTRLVEVMDAEGKSFSPKKYVPKVKLRTMTKEGEEVELDLTIKEAVKRMKDEPENYGNLFKSGLNGGLGAGGSAGATGAVTGDRPPSDPAQYRLWRQKQNFGKRGKK
jgi:Ca2+-binding RTX toxin-like protein